MCLHDKMVTFCLKFISSLNKIGKNDLQVTWHFPFKDAQPKRRWHQRHHKKYCQCHVCKHKKLNSCFDQLLTNYMLNKITFSYNLKVFHTNIVQTPNRVVYARSSKWEENSSLLVYHDKIMLYATCGLLKQLNTNQWTFLSMRIYILLPYASFTVCKMLTLYTWMKKHAHTHTHGKLHTYTL